MSDEITPQEPGAELNPATPGESPAVDQAKLDAILAGKAADIPGELDALGDAELSQLHSTEVAGKKRATVLKAIDTVAGQRAADAALDGNAEIVGASNANLGNRERYAQMRADQVDPSKIPGPVLTLDGWVLPHPQAQG